MQLPSHDAARSLALRLSDINYTVEGIRALLGTVASDALDRNATVPAREVLADDTSALGLAVRLFLLRDDVALAEIAAHLAAGHELDGLIASDGECGRSTVEVAPYASDRTDWFVASDWTSGRTGQPTPGDYVLGVGGASTMLAQCTVRPEIVRALDIGTGCGIQALHLTQHVERVLATDVNPRCLALAAFNASMNELTIDLHHGSLWEPVQDQSFDLIVSNPPFVIASPAAERHDYRDSGMAGDEVCARLVGGASSYLSPGGWCQLLANWEITDGDDWSAHPRAWLAASPLDAWVLQRDVQDPAAYVETWLRDSGDHKRPDYEQIYSQWMAALQARGIIGIGFGLINLRRGDRESPIREFQHAPQPLVQPIGSDVIAWFTAQDVLGRHPGSDLLRLPWRCAPDVEVIEESTPGIATQPARSVHRKTGMAWSGPIDEFGVALLSGALGQRALGDLLSELAARYDVDLASTLVAAVPIVQQLVAEGFLYLPAGSPESAGIPAP